MSPLHAVHPIAERAHDAQELGDQFPKVWLTAKSAAAYLDFSTVRAFRLWVRRHGIASARRGRTLLFARRDLDAAVRVGK